jgi:hypothetical protein
MSAGFQGYNLRELLGLQMTNVVRVRRKSHRYERVPRGTHGTIVRAPATETAEGKNKADPAHTEAERD